MPTQQIVAPSVFGLFDGVSFVASVASLVLAIVAIWLTVAFQRDASRVNADTRALLIEIREKSNAVTEFVMKELGAYNAAMRGKFVQNPMTAPQIAGPPGAPADFQYTSQTPDSPSDSP